MPSGAKFYNVDFERTQMGWRCSVRVLVRTRRQFTREGHVVETGAQGHGIIGFVRSAIVAAQRTRNLVKTLQAEPGEFSLT